MADRYDVRRDRILFVDVEMTCWRGPPPDGEEQEIIEFGMAEVNVVSLELLRTESLYVIPRRSTVSAFCEELTGIAPALLRARGRPLVEVAATLRKRWGTGSKAWMSWGGDKGVVDRDFAREGVPSPFSAQFADLGFLFGTWAGSRDRVGLDRALAMLGEERVGPAHSGAADAASAATAWISMAKSQRRVLETAV